MAAPAQQHEFPLFPLGLVALPTEIVPLHIFEERYKQMVAFCLEQGQEFGIVWLGDDGLREIGCCCRIDRVGDREDDGSVDIVSHGTAPMRVIARQSHLPYPAGIVELLPDSAETLDEALLRAARGAYGELVEKATDKPPEPARLALMDAYAMAATVDFGLEAKQGLLELRSENARLDFVRRLFRAASKRLDFVDRAQARAKSNGKVRFG